MRLKADQQRPDLALAAIMGLVCLGILAGGARAQAAFPPGLTPEGASSATAPRRPAETREQVPINAPPQVERPHTLPITSQATELPDYVLGSADRIRITVFGEPTLSGEYTVSSRGTVNLPLAGDIPASGLSLTAFRDQVVKAYEEGYLKKPKISMEVLTFRPFYILGEVSKPGQYPYTTGLTALNAVATAGGFTYRANTRKIFIKRAYGGGEKSFALTPQTTIAPGDTIRIPERLF